MRYLLVNYLFALIFLFLMLIILAIIFLYNSFWLDKLLATTYKVSILSFVPFINFYIFGTILAQYIHDKKIINKFTKYILLVLQSFIIIPKIGLFLYLIWYIYLIYCRIIFLRQYDNRFKNYIYTFILPGKMYKNCFDKIVEASIKKKETNPDLILENTHTNIENI